MTPPYAELVRQIATLYALPAALLASQVMQESSGRADAFRFEPSHYARYIQHHPEALGFRYGPLASCSYGLMQILLETALELGYTDPPELLFDPRVNMTWGAKKMRALWDREGGTDVAYRLALQGYNGRGIAAIAYAASVIDRAAQE